MADIQKDEFEVDTLKLLDCKELQFTEEESGYLTLEYRGNVYHKINPTRLIPFLSKDEFISMNYENEDKELIEVGVVRRLSDMEESQRKLISDYLEYKYHMPQITKIYSIRDNMHGAIFVKVDTDCGSSTICVTDWYQNFRLRDGCYLYVNDADGNKYYCPDVYKLDKKSIKVVENFM